MDRGRHRWRGVAFAVAPVPVRRQRPRGRERPSTAGHCRSVPVGRVSSSVRPLSSVMRLRRSRGDRRSHRSSSRQTNSMCGCCVGDLEFVAGGVRVTVRHSKVDQEGHDAVVGVPNGEPPDTSRCAGCSAPTRRTRPTPASRHEGGGAVDVTEQLFDRPRADRGATRHPAAAGQATPRAPHRSRAGARAVLPSSSRCRPQSVARARSWPAPRGPGPRPQLLAARPAEQVTPPQCRASRSASRNTRPARRDAWVARRELTQVLGLCERASCRWSPLPL